MSEIFLSIDPGTYRTGAALFDGPNLLDWWLVEASRRDPVELRIAQILGRVEEISALCPDLREVVCERTTAIESRRPAPELQVLARRLKSWATRTKHRYAWTDYHPSKVASHARPRGLARKTPQKEVLRLGVRMLYQGSISQDGKQFAAGDLDQNVVDSVAVGHCHICEQQFTALT